MLSPENIRDLLFVCLKTTYFIFDGVINTQVEGAAMELLVSPIIANLYMEWFKVHALQSFAYHITIWKMYADDMLVVLFDSLIEDLSKHINSIDPSIQFTRGGD